MLEKEIPLSNSSLKDICKNVLGNSLLRTFNKIPDLQCKNIKMLEDH